MRARELEPPRQLFSAEVDLMFKYHPPQNDRTVKAHEDIRVLAKEFAKEVIKRIPPSTERGKALESIREAMMWANAGIACRGLNGSGEEDG